MIAEDEGNDPTLRPAEPKEKARDTVVATEIDVADRSSEEREKRMSNGFVSLGWENCFRDVTRSESSGHE